MRRIPPLVTWVGSATVVGALGFEERHVPVTQQVDVPTMGTREVPVTTQREVPDVAPVPVPVYETRKEPVKLRIPNLFGCDDFCLKLWDRCKRVQTGVVMQPA